MIKVSDFIVDFLKKNHHRRPFLIDDQMIYWINFIVGSRCSESKNIRTTGRRIF